MSRKRTPDEKSTETTTAVAEPPAPIAEPPAPIAEPPAAVTVPPTAEAKAEGKSFADRVGQKKWVTAPDPFGIAKDNLAGVRLFESEHDGQMAIKFGQGRPEDKPSQAVIDTMKEAGYRWNTIDRIWAHPVSGESAMSTRIDAERLYQQVRQMIRKEKGIEPEQEVTF